MRFFISIIIFLLAFSSCKKESPILVPPTDYKAHIIPNKTDLVSKIAFGSGCKQDKNQSFWNIIKNESPDLWIWGGDNIYSDTEDRNVLRNNYKKLKQNRYYQDFITEVPVIGVWDDHDYGARDSGVDYPIKNESKEEFMTFFDIPADSGIRTHTGIYHAYEFGEGDKKVKIYLLDNRYFKTELQEDTITDQWYLEDNTGTVLGTEQWTWLENEIAISEASINIFVSGLQIIPNDHIYEKWGNFPLERQRFIDLIETSSISNPIVLSGDRHFAEYSIYNFDADKSLVEFTASGMTHSFEGVNEENTYRKDDLYDGRNFGIVEIQWLENPIITLSIFDVSGTFVSSIVIN